MMEQEGDGSRRGGGEMNNQPRDRVQPQPPPPPPPPQQPQQCPRCDSLNTKFCYYNNYSLSQPRYFCKTCRRYWTQGGTLRNVPVGGGSRKGKKAKNSSSSSSSSENSQPQQQKVVASLSPSVPSIATFYGSGGGYLASLAAFNQLNNPPSHPFGGGGDLASSNLGLLQGFNAAASVVSQHQIRPSQFYQMGSMSLYTSEQGGFIPSSMGGSNNNNTSAAAAAATHRDWPQSFINNNASSARPSDDASLWSTLSTTYIGTGGNSNRTAGAAAGGSSLVPNQWPDLQGFHPPPQ